MSTTQKLSTVILHLLKGIVFRSEQPQLWYDLLEQQAEVSDYFAVINLELQLDDNEGYAWLVEKPVDENNPLPRLVARRPLDYRTSLLCVLLRKKIAEVDNMGSETRIVVTREELVNTLRVFLPEHNNEVKTAEQIKATVNKVIELGFLRPLKNDAEQLEIQRFLITLVDADWIGSFNDKLAEYQDYAHSSN